MILLIAVAVAYSLISERKNKNTIQSKGMKYEDEYRWINDYMGDEY
jgi:hypothetical protein